MPSQTKPSFNRIAFFVHTELPTITAQEKRVACKPIKVKTRFGMKTRHVPHHYDNDELAAAKRLLKRIVEPFVPEQPFDSAVTFQVWWEWPWRKAEPKKNRTAGFKLCDTKPDCGNMTKALEDVMEELGFWKNDSRIAHPEMVKGWGDYPGLGIVIEGIEIPPPSFGEIMHLREFGG